MQVNQTTMLLRIGPIGNAVAGLLTILFWWIHPRPELIARAVEPRWMTANVLFILLVICLQLGIVGVWVLPNTSAAKMPALLPAFFANAALVGLSLFDRFVTVALVRCSSHTRQAFFRRATPDHVHVDRVVAIVLRDVSPAGGALG